MSYCIKCGKELPEGAPFCPWCGAKQVKKRVVKKRGNGQGSAIKRGSTWTAVWSTPAELTEDGTKLKPCRHWKGGFPSKSAALVYAATAEKPAAKVEYRPTLEDYYQVWKKGDYLDLGKSKQCAFRIAWNRLEDLHSRPVAELTVKELQSCVDDQADSHYTAKDMRTLLSHLYKLADAEDQAKKNLSQFIRIPPLKESERQPFSEEEVQTIWKVAPESRMAELILLMIYTGMMPGELKQLKVGMIDTEKREIIGCGLKTAKRKATPIVYPERISPIVEDLIATTESGEGYVLGMNTDNFYDSYHDFLKLIGIRNLPPYSCRHTTATALAMKNIAPSVIQEIMRHTKFATTQRYIHPDMGNAHAAVDSMS